MQKQKDAKPSYQDERDGLSIEEIVEQGSVIDSDDVQRRILRGDETKGDADERDAAGGPITNETPQGREESKNDKPGGANQNG